MTGIDASQKNINVAKIHSSKKKLKIKYICSSPEKLNIKKKFDIVLNMEIIEHVDDVNINKVLVSEGHANEYYGGKR